MEQRGDNKYRTVTGDESGLNDFWESSHMVWFDRFLQKN
jgi:hypothetical protein